MRDRFNAQLKHMNDELIEMGGIVEQAIQQSVKAFKKLDADSAHKAIDFDDEIDRREKKIEQLCLKLLLQQQPVARDLRQISSALKMITDLERIGDHAEDISEIVLALADIPQAEQFSHIVQMADVTSKMVTGSIDAFVKRDIELAQKISDTDDAVDELFVTVQRELLKLIHENPDNGERALDLIMVAKYFERIGDHAVNIAEWVAFSITGEHKKGDSLK